MEACIRVIILPAIFEKKNRKIMACIWAVIPFANRILFTRVPLVSLMDEGEKEITIRQLFRKSYSGH